MEIYDLFTRKLKGEISKQEFNYEYDLIRFADLQDINSDVLYGDI